LGPYKTQRSCSCQTHSVAVERNLRRPVMLSIPFYWEVLECVCSRTHGSSTISVLVASIVAKRLHASSATDHDQRKRHPSPARSSLIVRVSRSRKVLYGHQKLPIFSTPIFLTHESSRREITRCGEYPFLRFTPTSPALSSILLSASGSGQWGGC
jgi:hypothetical protein